MIERTFCFGKERNLVGTVCTPSVPLPGAPACGLVMFNAGVVHRVGPHRINVRLARLLAVNGIPSIRFDLAGQGDSARAGGQKPFEAQAVDDIRAAMDAFGEIAGLSHFALFGLCSSGVHSYAVAQVDRRICGLLLLDTFIYSTVRSRINGYVNRLRGNGNPRAIVRWGLRQANKLLTTLRSSSGNIAERAVLAGYGTFITPSKSQLARVLTQLHTQGTITCFAYSGTFQEYNYREQFNDAFRKFGVDRFVTSEYFEHMDHTITLIGDQATYMDFVQCWCRELNKKVLAH